MITLRVNESPPVKLRVAKERETKVSASGGKVFGGFDNRLWKPVISEKKELSWDISNSREPPPSVDLNEKLSIDGALMRNSNGFQESGDNDTFDRIKYNVSILAKAAIVYGNIICSDGTGYQHLNTGAAFDIRYPILWAASAINENATSTNTYTTYFFPLTTTQSGTYTIRKPVYVKGTLSGTLFTPVSATPLTQVEPTTDDGYCYLRLGVMYSTANIHLEQTHDIYWWKNGSFQLALPNAGRVNGHTVDADVPANAKFTDTTYSAATQSTNGLMSASDKRKLDGIDPDTLVPLATETEITQMFNDIFS